MSFVHLHVHSNYSLLRGADTVEDLALQASRHGMTALALTDRNNLYGAVPFQTACDEYNIRPIFGAELVTDNASCVALVKNDTGYATLCRAITALQLHEGQDPFDLAGHLAGDREGLVILSTDAGLLTSLKVASGPADLYVEIGLGPTRVLSCRAHQQTGLPLAATGPVWFVHPEDFKRHRLLTAIGLNTTLRGVPPAELAHADNWLMPPAMMAKQFAGFPEALANTQHIADQCRHRLELNVLRLPKYPFTNGRPAQEVLRKKVEAGLYRRYGSVSDTVRAQVEREMEIIRDLGYADYFLIVSDIVDAAKAMGIPTCGRGSAANSVVSYVLELTHVEPLAHNLYFERFLNRGRSDCPDVDIDFSWRDRDRVIDWVYRRYGRDRVAMISTHVTFAARGAVREIAKVWGLPPEEISHITKRLPSGWDSGGPITEWMAKDPRSAGLPVHEEPWTTIFALAEELNGFPKHLGVHAGGLVIAPTALTDYLPLQRAAKETDDGRVVVTQWDMYPVEDMGLVKIDLLGNRSLAVIDDAINAVEANTGRRIEYSCFNPVDDPQTREIVRKGDTMGCFYIESPSMRNLLKKLDCHTFDGLVAASSIVRPGIASSGMMQAYIERFHYVRRHGRHDPSWYLHPAMRKALWETYGVMAYQEDVLKVAEAIAGMNPGDSDGLRKAMSKKRDFVAIERYRQLFVGGALARGLKRNTVDELWRQIESFSGYSFCKAHSASFALVSYQAAYLRAHHPAEFMAAVLSNYGGYYSSFAYISEARRMGLRVLLPCVNRSMWHYTGADDWIRVGLGQLRHIHCDSVLALLRERERRGPYRNLADILHRVPIPAADVEVLIRAGALDSIADGHNRPELLRQLVLGTRGKKGTRRSKKSRGALHTPLHDSTHTDKGVYNTPFPMARPDGSRFRAAASDRQQEHAQSDAGQLALFPMPSLPDVEPVRDYDWQRVLSAESDCIGYTVSAHPLSLFRRELQKYAVIRATELERHIGKTVTLVGWQVTRKRLRTKQDDPMVFVTFEDTYALYETVIFPRQYQRFAGLTMQPGPFIVIGQVTEEYGAVTVIVKDLHLLGRQDRDDAPSPKYDVPPRAASITNAPSFQRT
ncbi:MAG: DNA polymerase III subunit alpha [Candidatus Zixiibacteriota bacterium]